RRKQPNLITRAKYYSSSGADAVRQMGLAAVAEPWGYICETYARFRIPASLRALVRNSWPEERPTYWVADSYDAESDISAALRRSNDLQNDRHPRSVPCRAFGNPGDGAADLGFPTRTGGGRVSTKPFGLPETYYPTANDYRSDKWPAQHSDWPRYIQEHGEF